MVLQDSSHYCKPHFNVLLLFLDLFHRVFEYAHEVLSPLIQEELLGKKIIDGAFNIRDQTSAYGHIGCESPILRSLLGRLKKAESGKWCQVGVPYTSLVLLSQALTFCFCCLK